MHTLTKEKISQMLEQLPNSFTLDDLIERLLLIEKVEEGIQQAEDGKIIRQADVKEKIAKWPKYSGQN